MPGFNAQDILKKQKPVKPVVREPCPPPVPVSEPEPVQELNVSEPEPDVVPLPVQSVVHEPQKAQEGSLNKKEDKIPFVGTKSIKDLPAGVIAIAKREFPDASNKDALTAYVYMKSGKAFPVDAKIKKMVARHNANNVTFESLADNITAVQSRLDGLSLALTEMEIAVSYILFDRLGFRQGSVATVEGIDFLEGHMEDLLQNLRKTTITKVKQDAVKEGRKKRPMNELRQ